MRIGIRKKKQKSTPCPCCGEYLFASGPGSYEICPVCGWEDDPVQWKDPDFAGGANDRSLRESRAIFQAKRGRNDEAES